MSFEYLLERQAEKSIQADGDSMNALENSNRPISFSDGKCSCFSNASYMHRCDFCSSHANMSSSMFSPRSLSNSNVNISDSSFHSSPTPASPSMPADSTSSSASMPPLKPEELPIIFMHGVGVGLLGYLPLILQVEQKARDRPMFFVEMPYVAMRLWEHIPTPFETAELIHAMLERHAFEKAAFVGHSFGSISVAWVRKMRPQIVDSMMLMDPVCLCLCWPKVAYNFIYKSPIFNPFDPNFKLMDLIISFCSSELSMSRTMFRFRNRSVLLFSF
jgi:hypothetical protein